MLARFGRPAAANRSPDAAGAAASRAASAPTKAGKGTTAPKPLGGQPPLKARSLKKPKAHAIIALVVGLTGDELVGVLDLLRAQRARSDHEPILVTDCDACELFRARGLAFEYLPAPGLRTRLLPQLDWELYLLRRLALLRRKWQPVRIVAFGPAAAEMLVQWKGSPFEDDSIHRVAAGSPSSAEVT